MTVKATQFRQNLFQILDQCRDTGETVRIERGGEIYDLISRRKKKRIEELEEHPGTIVGDPETFHLIKTWEWTPDDLS